VCKKEQSEMLSGNFLLIVGIILIDSEVRSFIFSFQRSGFSQQSNFRYQSSSKLYSSSSDEELKLLYEKAQLDDAEWFQRVLGEQKSVGDDVISTPVKEELVKNSTIRLDPIENQLKNSQVSNSELKRNRIDNDQRKALIELQYSALEIESIKDSVKIVILEKSVSRPRKGLPESWLKEAVDSGYKTTGSSVSNPSARRSGNDIPSTNKRNNDRRSYEVDLDDQTKEDLMRQRKRSRTDFENEDPNDRRARENEGESFSWKGKELADEEREMIGMNRKPRGIREEEVQTRRSSTMSERTIRSKSDWDDDKDEDGPSPFWPDAVEFKDMLLDESQWRAGLIGDWSIPIIKAETKWRYSLYKNWLKFLDDGLGDGFDMVEEFGEEEYGDDDGNFEGTRDKRRNEDDNDDDYDDRDRDGGRRRDIRSNEGNNRDRDAGRREVNYQNNNRDERKKEGGVNENDDRDRDERRRGGSIRGDNDRMSRSESPPSQQQNSPVTEETRSARERMQEIYDNEDRLTRNLPLPRKEDTSSQKKSRAQLYEEWVSGRVDASVEASGAWTSISSEQIEANKISRNAEKNARNKREEEKEYFDDDDFEDDRG
jgi:hypothetical protein